MCVVPVYPAVLGLLFVILAVRVILARPGVDVGDGDDDDLRRRIRVQGNFAEYVPLVLVLLGIADMRGDRALVLHIWCVVLVIGYVVHAVV